jgi:hypothetical protein
MSTIQNGWNGEMLYAIVQREVGPSIVAAAPHFARMMVRGEIDKKWASLPDNVRHAYDRAAGLIVCHSEDIAGLVLRALKCPRCNPPK